ncbi:MAG: hypothetical protein LUD51_04450 [Clostridia bacterium]|nr:hypothetical protein [Clostridia bacterium]
MVQYESVVLDGYTEGLVNKKIKANAALAAEIKSACNSYAGSGWTLKSMSSTPMPDYYGICKVVLVFERVTYEDSGNLSAKG